VACIRYDRHILADPAADFDCGVRAAYTFSGNYRSRRPISDERFRQIPQLGTGHLTASIMEESPSHPTSGGDWSATTAEMLRTLRDQAGQTLETHRRRARDIESDIKRRMEQVTVELARDRAADDIEAAAVDELRATLEQLQQAFPQKEQEVDRLRSQLVAQSSAYESRLAERENELDELREQLDRQLTEEDGELSELRGQSEQSLRERDHLIQERDSAQDALEALRAQECADCAQTRDQLSATQRSLQEIQQQLVELQQRHDDLSEQQRVRQEVLAEAEFDRDKIAELLQVAEQRILELNECAQFEEQLQQTEKKFELAQADTQKLEKENSELLEELAQRPETDDRESPELVSLRSERDALATRLVELEAAAEQTDNLDGGQEMEDLRRRFEMAVDDVRQLKQEKAGLAEQLEKRSQTQTSGAPAVDTGAMDWQAQKARLLAALNAEDDGEIPEQRVQERATIEGTISITDRVVAEKDAALAKKNDEIDQLRLQLESKPVEHDADAMKQAARDEILDADKLIQAERTRLESLHNELQDKLRTAELEISVQRAALARDQADVKKKMEKLGNTKADPTSTEGEKPRRRWLSALGLKEDEKE